MAQAVESWTSFPTGLGLNPGTIFALKRIEHHYILIVSQAGSILEQAKLPFKLHLHFPPSS